ncbi:hypothetical protein NP493_603g00029 [Ridgeia piscesae]|uniref:Protein kinase domain-containing protein n=1 Tax=Ridgeia piscesae TaxID=27915 RepID=A0AAD9NNX8_RIDPI|nr:hypothetical protein NP493_603g00029 [Ridgeia piscesae]
MVLEYCELGTLDEHVTSIRGKHGRQGLHEETAKVIFGQLCNALTYCHDNGIVHRNLKSKSVLLDSQLNVKLADFCLAKILQTFSWRALLVHPICSDCMQYSAPEMFYARRYDGIRADIWSL